MVKSHVNYDLWKKQGFLQTTEGNVVHYGFIESFIEELGTRYNIREIAFDRWGAVQMVQNLEGMLYSQAAITNSLMDKIAAKCRIQQKPETQEHSVDAYLEQLNNKRFHV